MVQGIMESDKRGPKGPVFRGTLIGAAELGWLQGVVDREWAGYAELARRACSQFGWMRPNGQAPETSCAIFLRRLARRGALRVVERERPGKRCVARDHWEILEALGTVPGFVECQPSGSLTVRPIAPEEWTGFRLHMDRYHYLGFTKPVGESICYAAFLGEELVALLVWGAAVLHNAPRDRFIGWGAELRARQLFFVVNNRRFLVLPWIRQPHLASRVLGACLRRLSSDWERTYGHPVFLAETFVDRARFKGTCYQASNWIYLGDTLGFSRTSEGFVHTGKPKACFVYPMHRRALQLLRRTSLEQSCLPPGSGTPTQSMRASLRLHDTDRQQSACIEEALHALVR